jgi:hypothetical protein
VTGSLGMRGVGMLREAGRVSIAVIGTPRPDRVERSYVTLGRDVSRATGTAVPICPDACPTLLAQLGS